MTCSNLPEGFEPSIGDTFFLVKSGYSIRLYATDETITFITVLGPFRDAAKALAQSYSNAGQIPGQILGLDHPQSPLQIQPQ